MPSSYFTAGLILAGGRSTRMGRDKSQMQVSGKTLLEHAHEMLKSCVADEILVSSHPGQKGLVDRYPMIGPVAGIEAGMAELINSHAGGSLIVVPVDMLLLNNSTLLQLKDCLAQADVAHFDYNPLPLALTISESVHEQIEDIAKLAQKSGGISIKALFKQLKSITIVPTKAQQSEFFNCNNPEQFNMLQHLLK